MWHPLQLFKRRRGGEMNVAHCGATAVGCYPTSPFHGSHHVLFFPFSDGSVETVQITLEREGYQDEVTELTDRLSALPDDLRISILLMLPLVDAVRTSELARSWSATWTLLPAVRLCEREFIVKYGEAEGTLRFTQFVDRVVNRHHGSILQFMLRCVEYRPLLWCRWLDKIQRDSLECLYLESWKGNDHEVLLESFARSRLKWVSLTHCIVRLPNCCSFTLLQTLILTSCGAQVREVERLVAGCLLLKNLWLIGCKQMELACLTVRSTRLEVLHVHASVFHVHLDTPSLVEAKILLWDHRHNIGVFKSAVCSYPLAMSLGTLPRIQRLSLSQCFLLGPGSMVPFAEKFTRLKDLELCADLKDRWEAVTLLSLLKQCPSLERLVISEANKVECMDSTEMKWEGATLHLCRLRKLEIMNFTHGSLSFVIKVLQTAPMLEELIFTNPLQVVAKEELCRYQWACRDFKLLQHEYAVTQSLSRAPF